MWLLFLGLLARLSSLGFTQDLASAYSGERQFIDLPHLDVLPYNVPSGLNIEILEKTTTSLKLYWSTVDESLKTNVTSWNVRYKTDKGEFKSEDLSSLEEFFMIEGLKVDTSYSVCISVRVSSDYNLHSSFSSKEYSVKVSCADITTIPYIRRDSVIALLLTMFALVIGVLVGVLKWWVAKSRHEKSARSALRSSAGTSEVEDASQSQRLKPECSIEEKT